MTVLDEVKDLLRKLNPVSKATAHKLWHLNLLSPTPEAAHENLTLTRIIASGQSQS